jgi:Ca-activated chloride channel family protein
MITRSGTKTPRERSGRHAPAGRAVISAIFHASAVLALIAAFTPALADSPARLVSRGNRSYAGGEYDEAIDFYEKASVRAPESPIVAFNTGDAYYRKGEYAAAREHYRDAALRAKDLSLEAKAWYNTGNCAFREGERQVDSDMEKALEFFEESVQLYTTALGKDPDLGDAAHNIEVARLIIKDLLDRIQKQQEQMQQQQERFKAVVDSLRALIRRQEEVAAASAGLDAAADRSSARWNAELRKVEERQEGIADGTAAVQDSLHAFFPDSIPVPVEKAASHLDSSLVDQSGALGELAAREPGRAVGAEEASRDQLKKALDALTEGQEGSQGQEQPQESAQQQQQEPQQQEQQKEEVEQEKRSETAQGILDEEKENREKRQRAAQSYRAVDKDW